MSEMSEKRLEEVEVEIDDDLFDKIIEHLGTDEPEVISVWVSETLRTVFTEYLDKEMQG